jgi:hypothetical protein
MDRMRSIFDPHGAIIWDLPRIQIWGSVMPTIVHGHNKIRSSALNGLTVRQAYDSLKHLLMLVGDVFAVVRGDEVDYEYCLADHDKLGFVDIDTNVGRVWTADEFCQLFTMTGDDLNDWIEQGLPVEQLRDGTIRIVETVVDAFFSQRKENLRENTADGPFSHGKIRLNGHVYDGFANLEMRVMRCLWGKDGVEADTLCQEIYGTGHERKDIAFASLVKRVKRRLREVHFPGTVRPWGGKYYIVHFPKRMERGTPTSPGSDT